MNLFDDMRAAVESYDEWPTPEGRGRVLAATRKFVRAVTRQEQVIEQMRQHVTPSEQALRELIGER
jgi:hypothetical protein